MAVMAAAVVAAADMAAAAAEEEAAAATAAAIADRAKRPIQYFCSKGARYHSRALFRNSFSRSDCNVLMIRLSIEPRRAYGGGVY